MVFQRGTIVDPVWNNDTTTKKTQKARKNLQQTQPYKLIVLRKIDENNYLVAICKKEKKNTQLEIETSVGTIYVKTSIFYPVDVDSLQSCDISLIGQDRNNFVKSIYKTHNAYIEEKKRLRLEKIKAKQKSAAEKRAKKKQINIEQRKTERKHIKSYELAVLNNDTKTIHEIEAIYGCRPGLRNSNCKPTNENSYSNINPHPYSGGRFSSK